MKKINIIHILPSLEIGGMENGVVNLLNGIDRVIFNPFVCCLEREGALKNRLNNDVKVFNLNQKEGIRLFLSWELKKLFSKYEIDIVHTHNFYTAVYGIIAARIAKVPVTIHGEHGLVGRMGTKRKMILRFLSCFSDLILTVSETLKDILIKDIGIRKDKIATIVNGIELATFLPYAGPSEKENGKNGEKKDPIVGTVGRLIPIKDQKTLITAFSNVARLIPSAKLWIVGNGPLRNELENMVKNLGLESKVKFFGERNDPEALYKMMDVFVLSSLSEGMSNVILEAMAAGLPVIATRVGDNPRLVKDGETGILVAASNPQGISSAIIRLLSDPRQAKQMGESGFRRVKENFSLEKMIKEYERTYKFWFEKKTVNYR